VGSPVLRVIRACAIPCVVLGAALYGVLVLAALPATPAKLDLAGARAVIAAQWRVPVIAIHATLVFAGLLAPFLAGGRATGAAARALRALPALWLHVVASQLLVAIALVAGVVPGILALAPALFVGAAVAGGARGTAAFDAAAAVAAPRRWRVVGLALALIALEIGLTIGMRELLVPALGKKSPPIALAEAYRYAQLNAIRAAACAPVIGAVLAALHARWSHRDAPPA
jgi:hypothetical protein